MTDLPPPPPPPPQSSTEDWVTGFDKSLRQAIDDPRIGDVTRENICYRLERELKRPGSTA